MKTVEGGRAELAAALAGKGAHVDFDGAIKNFPPDLRGVKPEKVPHTGWQLLEHIRISQADILDFCVNPKYKELKWPEEYWPASAAPRRPRSPTVTRPWAGALPRRRRAEQGSGAEEPTTRERDDARGHLI